MYKVLVTVPNMHWIHTEVVSRLLRLIQDTRYPLTFKFPSAVPFENNLNQIVLDFLAGDWTHWLSIDADNPPCQNPLDLVILNKDVIGLPTPVWHYLGKPNERPVYWNAYKWDESAQAFREYTRRDGLQRVDAVGTGCFIATRRVFEHPGMKGPFLRTWKDDGTVDMGNDLAFCRRATKAGFEIYAHFDYPCDHHNEINLNDVARAMKDL
jgi:hypothetical protein